MLRGPLDPDSSLKVKFRDATQSPRKFPIFAKDRGGGGVNPGFGKIETKDSKYGRDVLFGGLQFVTK